MANFDLGIHITAINNASAAIRGVGDDVKGIGDNAQATSNRLKAIQVVIAGILINKTLEWGKALITTNAALQNSEIRMASFAGGSAQMQTVMSKLNTEFAATPFKMDGIADAWTRVQSAIGNNDKTTSIIESIVNDVAAMGGKDENIDNLAQSFQRMFATGVASAREYKSILTETGLTLADLAAGAGQSIGTFQSNLQRGFESASNFTQAFINASNTRFAFFAQNLKNSVGGAFNLISNTVNTGLANIGANTNLNAHLTAFFQNLATAISGVMSSIKQPQIDAFFKWLQDMEPLVTKTGIAILNLGTAVLTIGTAVGVLLGKMTSDQLEFGMIGYFLLGKKGALIGAAIGGIVTNVNKLGDAQLNGTAPKPDQSGSYGEGWQGFKNMLGSAFGLADVGARDLIKKFSGPNGVLTQIMGGGNATGKSIFGSDAQLKAIEAAIQKMKDGFKGGSPETTDTNSKLSQAIQQANDFATSLNATLAETQDKIDELNYATAGDQLGANMSKLTLQGDQFNKTVAASQKAFDALTAPTQKARDAMAAIRAEADKYGLSIDAAKAKLQLVYGLEQQQFVLEQQKAVLSAQSASLSLRLAANNNGVTNAYLGTSAGQNQVQTLQQQFTYLQDIATLKAQIFAIDQQEQAVLADPAKVAALEAQKTAINGQLSDTENALHSLSAVGQLTNQLWQNLGQTMENDVSSGITGILTGTETFAQALKSIFSDLIGLGVKYLIQLVEMQLFSKTAHATALATSAPVAAAMTALWGPPAMAASIASFGAADATGAIAYQTAMASSLVPFANGGVPGLGDMSNSIVSGPTMFGVAGEAGSEAIMPLTRIGGKLGVRSDGGGGSNHYHIHLQSIDTQSGMQFIAKNIETIDSHLQQKKRLNRASK